MISLALLTMGAQVAQIQYKLGLSPDYASLLLRLVIGPILALAIIFTFRVDGIVA